MRKHIEKPKIDPQKQIAALEAGIESNRRFLAKHDGNPDLAGSCKVARDRIAEAERKIARIKGAKA